MFFQESFELFEYIYEYDILICILYILNDKLHITMKAGSLCWLSEMMAGTSNM